MPHQTGMRTVWIRGLVFSHILDVQNPNNSSIYGNCDIADIALAHFSRYTKYRNWQQFVLYHEFVWILLTLVQIPLHCTNWLVHHRPWFIDSVWSIIITCNLHWATNQVHVQYNEYVARYVPAICLTFHAIHHVMMASSNGNIFRVTGPLWGEFTGSQKPVTRIFDVFFDMRLNERLSKQSWGWWFETPSRSLCHYNVSTGRERKRGRKPIDPNYSLSVWFRKVVCENIPWNK